MKLIFEYVFLQFGYFYFFIKTRVEDDKKKEYNVNRDDDENEKAREDQLLIGWHFENDDNFTLQVPIDEQIHRVKEERQ